MISAVRLLPALPVMLLASVLQPGCAMEQPAPPPPNAAIVYATLETDPVASGDDAADDPAIWVHPDDASRSLVLGTDKQAGLEVYDLQGRRQQFIRAGLTNNVDLRYLTRSDVGGTAWSAIAAASNRSNNSVSLFAIDRAGQVTWLRSSEIDTGLTEPYGLCMFRNAAGLQLFVNDTNGRYQQWLLETASGGASVEPLSVRATLLREFAVSSQPEGCVADDARERLFVGVENEGIYAFPASHTESPTQTTVMEIDDSILAADVEGMSLYVAGDAGYLVVSSQGNFSYAVYDRLPPFAYRGSFMVADRPDGSVDGAQETDGLDVSSVPLGSQFERGLLVVQDGFNTLPDATQGFKYIFPGPRSRRPSDCNSIAAELRQNRHETVLS